MPRASKQQARYAVGRCLMLWSSNDVTQQGSRPKTKLTRDENLESIIDGCESEKRRDWLRSRHTPSAKGEQLLFKALTYNQWLLVGRKTFESMGALPNRKYAVVTRSGWTSNDDNVVVFQSIEEAMDRLAEFTGHVIVSGGGEIYRETLPMASTLHLSTIDIEPEGMFSSRVFQIPSKLFLSNTLLQTLTIAIKFGKRVNKAMQSTAKSFVRFAHYAFSAIDSDVM